MSRAHPACTRVRRTFNVQKSTRTFSSVLEAITVDLTPPYICIYVFLFGSPCRFFRILPFNGSRHPRLDEEKHACDPATQSARLEKSAFEAFTRGALIGRWYERLISANQNVASLESPLRSHPAEQEAERARSRHVTAPFSSMRYDSANAMSRSECLNTKRHKRICQDRLHGLKIQIRLVLTRHYLCLLN